MRVDDMMRAIMLLCGRGVGIRLGEDGWWFVDTGSARISLLRLGKSRLGITHPQSHGDSPEAAVMAWWMVMVYEFDDKMVICRVLDGRETMLRWDGQGWVEARELVGV